jgi:UDP-N-acetyl-D-galactosamine dehydrogenase
MLTQGNAETPLRKARVGILGLTFKENVPDLRNSKIPDIVKELAEYGITAMVHDAMGDAAEAKHEYGIDLVPLEQFTDLDALFLAVSHEAYLKDAKGLQARIKPGGVFIDVKSVMHPSQMTRGIRYWSL